MDNTENSVKMEEEPVPSSEVLELRQKVVKLEKEKQGAIRIAGEAQARVEFLENLIDKKRVSSDDGMPEDLENLKSQLEKERSRATEDRRRDAETIDELRRRLAQYEVGQPQPPPPVPNATLLQLIQSIYPNGLPPPADEQEQVMYDEIDPNLDQSNDISLNTDEVNEPEQDEIEGDVSTESAIEMGEVKDEEAIAQSKKIPKKRKSSNKGDSESELVEKKHRGAKRNATDLECPECEYRTRSVRCWDEHLRTSHFTTPMLAGFTLLCECGNVSTSAEHSRSCDHRNTVLIRKNNNPITPHSPATPKCILCEKFPKSIRAYTYHLHTFHNTTLKENNVYLKCSCGFDVFNDNGAKRPEHAHMCTSHDFTLHKLDEK